MISQRVAPTATKDFFTCSAHESCAAKLGGTVTLVKVSICPAMVMIFVRAREKTLM